MSQCSSWGSCGCRYPAAPILLVAIASSWCGAGCFMSHELEAPPASSRPPCTPGDFPEGLPPDGEIEMTSFQISRALCGVSLDEGAEVDLHDGVVSECTFGVCYDTCSRFPLETSRLTDGVAYRDNVHNLPATVLPITGWGCTDR